MIKLFEVGGCVRDSLLRLPSKDIDYAVEAPGFEEMRQEMIQRGFKIFQENPEFFVIRAKFPDFKLVADFVLCRKESGFSDARHPDKVEAGSIFDDLARRDFTVNAIAKCVESGELIDPHGGIADLKSRTLRAVGNPEDRFNEDALRILRALRFSISKELNIHKDIWQAFNTVDPNLLAAVSPERKREELNKMFASDSLKSVRLIAELPATLQDSIFSDGVWLKATMEAKK